MTDRPILFTGPMVRAILDGRKTVTRRLVTGHDVIEERDDGTPWPYYTTWSHGDDGSPWMACPYGVPGDRLWVRETWQIFDPHPDGDRGPVGADRLARGQRAPWDGVVNENGANERAIEWVAAYRADGEVEHPVHGKALWRSPRYMPRWASRITIDVISVRVERLHAITEEDASREGVEYMDGLLDEADLCRVAKAMGAMATDSRVWFACLWDSLNAKRAPWASDPWVWRVEFRRAVTP